MKLRNYSHRVRVQVNMPARTEVQFYVPDTSHGYTLDRAEAEEWAQRAAIQRGYPVPVLTRTVNLSVWSVLSDPIAG